MAAAQHRGWRALVDRALDLFDPTAPEGGAQDEETDAKSGGKPLAKGGAAATAQDTGSVVHWGDTLEHRTTQAYRGTDLLSVGSGYAASAEAGLRSNFGPYATAEIMQVRRWPKRTGQ